MIARRNFLVAVGAAAVAGFDPRTRRWVNVAQAESAFDAIPPLDGLLLTDPASRAADAVDVGNIVHNTPVAVLRPGSVEDIQKMVRFCRRLNIKVAARGQGHTTQGQSQVRGGLVIEMSDLNTIHSLGPTVADVDAGLLWRDLLTVAVPQGLTPPVLTGYTGLSIGGTLSVGGISSTVRRGAQVDNVEELDVVTGEGSLVRCSIRSEPDLFQSALAGLGQFGIITRAVINLVAAPALARVFLINYTDSASFFADFRELLNRGELDDVYNYGLPDGKGGWIYQLTAAKFFDPSSPPSASLLRGLRAESSSAVVQDIPYLDYVLREDAAIDQIKALGLWSGVLHPWFDVFLPNCAVEQYVSQVTSSLAPDDVGATGFLLLFAQRRSALTRPLLRVPDSTDWVFLFDILTAAAAPGPDPAFEARILSRNRRLFEDARFLGGTRYPIGSIQFDRADWIRQYGPHWPEVVRLKHRFDPDGILTPGPGIF